jgi:DNA repair protein RadC
MVELAYQPMRNKYLRKLHVELVDGDFKNPMQGQVRAPEQVYEVFQAIKDKAQETLIGLYLSADLEPILYDVLSIGGEREALILPDEIFGRAFITRAKYLILIHNHPGGDPSPSPSDREAMEMILRTAQVVQKELLDFIIVGADTYWSMFEEQDGGEYALGTIAI